MTDSQTSPDGARSDSDDPGEELQNSSLEDLGRAYAQLVGGGSAAGDRAAGESSAHAAGEEEAEQQESREPSSAPAADEGQQPVEPRGIVEAMLFVGDAENRPLAARQMAALIRGVSPREVEEIVADLNQGYSDSDAPYEIVGGAAGYRLVLREKYAGLRDQFYGRVREARLSQAAIDVLAIVAYNQQVTKDEVERLRDRPSGPILNQLVRRQLLELHRAEDKKQPATYRTTGRFLSLFGLDSLEDLPRSRQLERGL